MSCERGMNAAGSPQAGLVASARALLAGDRGLLAMDESTPTCNKRFARVGIPETENMRRAWRELIVTTPGLSQSISGAILYDETIRQQTGAGVSFVEALSEAGIVPGIKVDGGAHALAAHPGEKVSEGLDGLRERFAEYERIGARFAKWRAVFTIAEGLPTPSCIAANAHALARYAALAQEAGLVPIVEPEVLMDGAHTLERCAEVTTRVLQAVFRQLVEQRVLLEATIVKPNMVLPGQDCEQQASADEVADATLQVLSRAVPAAVAGIAFLSGGQPAALASARLNAMNVRARACASVPWPLSFSFARAIQQDALEIWRGQPDKAARAQQALLARANDNRAARRGEYSAVVEMPSPAGEPS
jgi:fructose-bisphosphate aldolase class I